MGKLISFIIEKNKRNGVITLNPDPMFAAEQHVEDRIKSIRASLAKIDRLMAELKAMGKKNDEQIP